MRRLRRGTFEGTARKLFVRGITQNIKRLTRQLAGAKSPEEVDGLMTRLMRFRALRKATK